jgi:hypothetical protein
MTNKSDDKVKVTVYLDRDLYKWAKHAAIVANTTVPAIMKNYLKALKIMDEIGGGK